MKWSMLMAMAALVIVMAGNASAAVPGWTKRAVDEVVPTLLEGLALDERPRITLRWKQGDHPPGVRIIESQTRGDEVLIQLLGSWRTSSEEARSQLVRNLAHELAHVWQWSLGDPVEPRLLHEGFAEAIAIDLLVRCRELCRASPERLVIKLEGQCRYALQMGRVGGLNERGAIYGCGAVLTESIAVAAQLSPQDLYRRYTETDRSMSDFLDLTEQLAGQRYAVSARTFLTADLRMASPSTTMGRLRAGRL
ncbi:MAG: hypothetical protein AAF608_03755 [Pseudomonadota bacterium]